MNETRETKSGRDGAETLEEIQALFQRWRESRRPGARIPKDLWAAAVRMAKHYGVPQTVQHLRVEGPQLLKRMEGAGGAAQTGPRKVAFVALPGSTPAARSEDAECVVELQISVINSDNMSCFSWGHNMARPAGGVEHVVAARELLRSAKTAEELRRAQAVLLPWIWG